MAEMIYLNDGTMEGIYDEEDEPYVLERIIRERLGNDMANLFRDLIADLEAGSEDYDAEMAIDEYSAAIRDIGDHISGLLKHLDEKRINRKIIRYYARHIEQIVNDNT